jgi:hypothetical protein
VARNDPVSPLATAEWGWRYHHIGIPTNVPQPGEFYIDAALEGKELLSEVSSPSPGVRVAMIVHGGAPIELIEFQKTR